jgi:hypothetical protein
MMHQRSQIFSDFPVKMNTDACEGHFYVTKLAFSKLKGIQHLEFTWIGQKEALSINKITLINETTRAYIPLDPVAARGNQWLSVKDSGEARVYENLLVMPRAWLTSETALLKREEILTSIRTSKLPSGLPYDPTRTALVEDSEGLMAAQSPRDLDAKATVVRSGSTGLEVQTSSLRPSFLVTSDIYYPGWKVYVDGAPAQLFLANYAFRGVKLPAGQHQVRFEFAPGRFYFGAGISVLSLLILTGFVLLPRFRKPARQMPEQTG